MPIKFCCTDLEYAISAGDISHNEDENEFHVYGRPSFVDDGDGYTDDMTEMLKMSHCLFCGKRLAPLCGPNEVCFEKGECWGHLEGVMCKYLSEGENGFVCKKINIFIKQHNVYTTHKEYKRILN